LFQMCLEQGYDSSSENQAICIRLIQRIPETQLAEDNDDELRARRHLLDKHSCLLTATKALDQELIIKQQMQQLQEDSKVEEGEGSSNFTLSHPVLEFNERLVAMPKKSAAALRANKKRTMEEKEGHGDDGEEPKKSAPPVPSGALTSAFVDLDQKEGDRDIDDDEDEDASDDGEGQGTVQIFHRLSQLDRILAFEQFRTEALETAHAWLESENGKKMIAQVANVMISENRENMTSEAALELARRNFIEEHVKESMVQFQHKLTHGEVVTDEKELST